MPEQQFTPQGFVELHKNIKPSAGDIGVKLSDGRYGTISMRDLGRAENMGARAIALSELPDPEQYIAERGGLATQLAGFGVSALSSAASQGSPLALAGVGAVRALSGGTSEEFVEATRGIAKAAPTAATVGNLAGIGLGIADPTNITRAIPGGSGVAGRLMQNAASGAIQGAMGGVAEQLLYAEKPELSAELLSHHIAPMMLGSALGAGLRLGGARVGGLAGKAVEHAVAPVLEGATIGGLMGGEQGALEGAAFAGGLSALLGGVGAARSGIARLRGEASPVTAGLVEAATGTPYREPLENLHAEQTQRRADFLADPQVKAAEQLGDVSARKTLDMIERGELERIKDVDAVIEKGAADIYRESRPVTEGARVVYDEAYATKPQKVRETVSREPLPEQLAEAIRLRDGIQEMVDFWTEAGDGKTKAAMRSAGSTIKRLNAAIEKPGNALDSAELFTSLDATKKQLDGITPFRIDAPNQPLYARPGGEANPTPSSRVLGDRIRAALEREDLWGRAASDQRQMNAAMSDYLASKSEAMNMYATRVGSLTADDVSIAHIGNADMRLDPEKFATHMKGALRDTSVLQSEVLDNFIAKSQRLTETLERVYGDAISPRSQKAVQEQQAALQKIQQTRVESMRLAQHAQNRAKALAAEESNALTNLAGAPIAAALGSLGGPVLGIAGAALAKKVININEPFTQAEQRWQVQAAMREAQQRTNDVAEKFFGREVFREPTIPQAQVAATAKAAIAASSPSGMQNALMRIDRMLRPLQALDPKLAAQVAGRQAHMLQLLANAAPRAPYTPSLTPQLDKEPEPSRTDLDRFEKLIRSVQPKMFYADVASGTASPQQVELFRTLYPETFEQLKSSFVDQLAQRKTPVPFDQSVKLGQIFGIVTDPSMDPKFLAAIRQPAPEQEPGGITEMPRARAGRVNTGQQKARYASYSTVSSRLEGPSR